MMCNILIASFDFAIHMATSSANVEIQYSTGPEKCKHVSNTGRYETSEGLGVVVESSVN